MDATDDCSLGASPALEIMRTGLPNMMREYAVAFQQRAWARWRAGRHVTVDLHAWQVGEYCFVHCRVNDHVLMLRRGVWRW